MTTRHRASSLCLRNDEILCVELVDPITNQHYRMPPGGGIEVGETPLDAAVRETREETGVEAKLTLESSFCLDYPFYWAGKNFFCRTQFFFAEVCREAGVATADESYHRGWSWVTVSEFIAELEFNPTLKEGLERSILLRT